MVGFIFSRWNILSRERKLNKIIQKVGRQNCFLHDQLLNCVDPMPIKLHSALKVEALQGSAVVHCVLLLGVDRSFFKINVLQPFFTNIPF